MCFIVCVVLRAGRKAGSGERQVPFPSAIRLLKQWSQGIFFKNPMLRDGKSWRLAPPRGGICLPRRDSHSSDTFLDYLAGETRTETVMGNDRISKGLLMYIQCLPAIYHHSCLVFKCKPWGWQDGSVGKGSSSPSWGLELDPRTQMVGENWLGQRDFWFPTCLVRCDSFPSN